MKFWNWGPTTYNVQHFFLQNHSTLLNNTMIHNCEQCHLFVLRLIVGFQQKHKKNREICVVQSPQNNLELNIITSSTFFGTVNNQNFEFVLVNNRRWSSFSNLITVLWGCYFSWPSGRRFSTFMWVFLLLVQRLLLHCFFSVLVYSFKYVKCLKLLRQLKYLYFFLFFFFQMGWIQPH